MKKFEHKNKDERRRVLLSKNNELSHTFDNEKLPEGNEAAQANGAGVMAKLQNMNKRVLAVVLAIVFILSVVPTSIFVLRGKANSISGLEPVTMNVRVNGADLDSTAVIKAGVIEENIDSVQLSTAIPEGCFFEKAVVVDTSTGAETEIASVGAIDTSTYYSLDKDTNTGTKLDAGKQLVLVYAAKYKVTVPDSEHGDITTNALEDDDGSLFVWGGESLRVQMTPDTDYRVDKLSYTMGGKNRTAKTTDGNAVISNASGDIVINDPFTAVEGYVIRNVTNIKDPSVHGNGNLAEDLGQDTYVIANDKYLGYKYEYALYKSSYPPEPIAPNTSDTFYLYSDSNTAGSEFLLNMFRVNGEEFPVEELSDEVGSEVSKTLEDGTIVTLRVHGFNQGIFWLDNNPTASTDAGHEWDIGYNWTANFSGLSIVSYTYNAKTKSNGDYDWQKKRTIYEIEVQNAHEDLNVEYNFKQKNSREMIIKGLRGIEETGASAEERGADRYLRFSFSNNTITIADSLPGINVETRNYTLQKSNVNIYPSYYREQYGTLAWSFMPSSNLYLYRVKEGYNPYSVAKNVEAHYYNTDGSEVNTSQYGVLASETAERPDDAIVTATKAAGDVAAEAANSMGLDTSNALVMQFLESMYSFNNYLRNWGGFSGVNEELKNSDITTARAHLDWGSGNYHNLLLTDIAAEEAADPSKTWYAVALLENAAYNQQMIMNADPYNYYLCLDLGEGGSLANAAERFNANGNILTEKAEYKHTVEDKAAYILLPENTPTNSDPNVIFTGWRMVDKNGSPIEDAHGDEIIYQSLAQIKLSGDNLSYAFGKDNGSDREEDQIIALEAVWTPITQADVTTILVEAWYEVPSDYDAQEGEVVEEKTLNDVTKKYLRAYRTTELQAADEETALLNQHEPDNRDYYVVNPASKVKSITDKQSDINTIPEDNKFIVYYDFALETVTVTKRVLGNPKALKTGFPITIKLTREDDNSPVLTAEEAKSMLVLSNGDQANAQVSGNDITYTKTFLRSEELAISNVPYGWKVTVTENKATPDESGNVDYTTTIVSDPESAGSQTSTEDDTVTKWEGVITENTDIDVTNKSDSYLELNKKLTRNEDGTYDITLEAYANGDVLKDTAEVKVPTDYILILDQSGSMDTKDMPVNGYTDLGTGGNEGWQIDQSADWEESSPRYYYDGTRYYRVYRKWGTMVNYQSSITKIGSLVPTSYDQWFQDNDNGEELTKEGNNGYYYKDNNDDYYPIRIKVEGELLKYKVTLSYIDKNGVTHSLAPKDFGVTQAGLTRPYRYLDAYCYQRALGQTGGLLRNETLHFGVYKKTVGYNQLCYKDKDGVEHVLLGTEECATFTSGGNPYTDYPGRSTASGSVTNVYYSDYPDHEATNLSGLKDHLYKPTGTESRVYALNDALKRFINHVSSQENTDGSIIENRVAIVGFSSPNDTRAYNNTELLTGVDVVSGNYGSNQGFSLDDPYQFHNGPQYSAETGKTDDLEYATNEDYENSLLSVTTQKDDLLQAADYITAYGGTKPVYGFEMAEQIIENRGESAKVTIGESKKKVDRNVAVVFFTDGRPGNQSYVDQITEANDVVLAASNLKDKATIYSIGVFGESDNNPLTYPKYAVNSQNEDYTFEDGYAKTEYKAGKYHYLFRNWMPNSAGYPTSADDTIQAYMETVSSDYPNAKKFYQAPVGDDTYEETIYSENVRGTRAEGTSHYYTAGNIEDLREAFTTISDDVISTSPGAADDSPMVLRDVINTDDFDIENSDLDVKAYTVKGKALNASNNDVTWSMKNETEEDRKDFDDATIDWSDDGSTVDIGGFDFKQNYIANSKPADPDNELGETEESEGRKLVVTISGLVPKKDATGKLESNRDDSGIYKMVENENPEEPATALLQNAFDVPHMYRYRYNLLESGDRTADTFDVALTRLGADGVLALYDEHDNRSVEMKNGNTYLWADVPNGSVIYLETFDQSSLNADVVLNEATIAGNLKNTDVYSYNLTLETSDDSTPELLGPGNGFDTEAKNSTFHIRNTSNYRDVIITEETRGKPNEADYSDPTHQFPIRVHYTDADGNPFTGDVEATITRASDPDHPEPTTMLHFDEDGWSIGDFALADGDKIEFKALEGYKITTYEDPDDAGNYAVSYEETDGDDEDGQTTTIAIDNQIKVINTLKENPVITGIGDADSKVNPFIIAAGIVAALGGAWLGIMAKRKRQMAER